ncbi:DUF6279 family lipoprotein [Paraferrimonas haliotis]|uniref:Lipoprotein n=1 Tax=Paraferrimonas haliotis TaxID=2013866 RepID=A0AA37TYL7_9GAMM|nr:DUF6279 family lipoprotein [Paraferrimonas haliotis]GLS84700.1 hypothetical protein GCM10007894_26770 [Paraferrimonas haliotis]
MKKPWLLLLTVLMIGGCSSVKMGYYFADWAIGWKLSDYVKLNKEQKAELNQEIETFLAWHKQTEMAQYADQLARLSSDIAADSVTQEQIQAHFDELGGHWKASLAHITPALVRLMPSLSDKQVSELLENIREESAERAEERAEQTDEERLEANQKRWKKNLKKYLGSVSSEQQILIDEYLSKRLRTFDLWNRYQEAWYQEFEHVLAQRNQPEFANELKQLLENPESLRSPELQQNLTQNRQHLLAFMQQLHQSLSAKQKAKLLKRVDKLQRDVADLASD